VTSHISELKFNFFLIHCTINYRVITSAVVVEFVSAVSPVKLW